jgi:hypothetical protein
MSEAAGVKTPWHLWAVGIVGILWNGFGCFDYFMTQTKGDDYMTAAGMTEAQIAFMHKSPAWMTAVWAIGVWGGLAGAVLLLLRKKLAVPVFIASLVSYSVSVLYNTVISPMPGASEHLAMFVVIFAGCVFFVWYSLRATKQGLLT